jgi:hypothetical protein
MREFEMQLQQAAAEHCETVLAYAASGVGSSELE